MVEDGKTSIFLLSVSLSRIVTYTNRQDSLIYKNCIIKYAYIQTVNVSQINSFSSQYLYTLYRGFMERYEGRIFPVESHPSKFAIQTLYKVSEQLKFKRTHCIPYLITQLHSYLMTLWSKCSQTPDLQRQPVVGGRHCTTTGLICTKVSD